MRIIIKSVLCKADPIGEDDIVDSKIIIDQKLPNGDTRRRDIFIADARRLVSHLYLSLPGGTIDQILIEMLKRRASSLVVPMEKNEND